MVKVEKLFLKTKAIDNLLWAPMDRAPQSYPRKSVNSKTPKIELNSYTKPGPHCFLAGAILLFIGKIFIT